jgi:transcriptional regulator with XRE-family HTH domain
VGSVASVPGAADPEPAELTHAVSAIVAALTKSGLSQRAFAPIVRISQSQLSKLLRGEATWKLEQLDLICHELGISIAEVIDAADYAAGGRFS